ncbi:hypothetical protein [Desulfarculus baarsii]
MAAEIKWQELMGGVLAFVGAVTASATHEIKNELAVINEQGSLVQELLQMAARGREVDPARLEELIGRVLIRVARADGVVKRLNAFAHSADLERQETDPAQSLELIGKLFGRLAGLRGLTLELAPTPAGLVLPALPVLFEQVVWACLRGAADVAAKGSTLRLGLTIEGDAARLLVEGELAQPPALPPAPLLTALRAEARVVEGRALSLRLPLAGAEG